MSAAEIVPDTSSSPNFKAIFGIWLATNVIVTIRSTQWFEKQMAKCFSKGDKSDVEKEDAEPLLSSSSSAAASKESDNKKHKSLLIRYLSVYLLAALSDWLQGPYVYALYDAYGFDQHDIAVLFVAGFGSSMVFGSFIGGMADAGGRRKFVVIFCITYAASCMTKHCKDYWMLMIGRLLGGICTSLLFSIFDSWLIKAHAKASLDKMYLARSFSTASYGNSIIAIIAGLVANKAASSNTMELVFLEDKYTWLYSGGYLNPFDLSIVVLVVCGVLALCLWDENYGEEASNEDSNSDEEEATSRPAGNESSFNCVTDMVRAYNTLMRNREILLCGLVSSVFEASMYVFVFMWTPAMTTLTDPKHTGNVELPFGLIFSTFMVCCMIGSSLFSIIIGYNYRPETITIFVLFTAMMCFISFAFSTSSTLTYISMCIFEISVGVYFPVMGTMKSVIVPEGQRSAIYNLYRVPLNLIVVFTLVTHLTITQSFSLCVTMLGVGVAMQIELNKRRIGSVPAGTQVQLVSNDEEKRKMVSPDITSV